MNIGSFAWGDRDGVKAAPPSFLLPPCTAPEKSRQRGCMGKLQPRQAETAGPSRLCPAPPVRGPHMPGKQCAWLLGKTYCDPSRCKPRTGSYWRDLGGHQTRFQVAHSEQSGGDSGIRAGMLWEKVPEGRCLLGFLSPPCMALRFCCL